MPDPILIVKPGYLEIMNNHRFVCRAPLGKLFIQRDSLVQFLRIANAGTHDGNSPEAIFNYLISTFEDLGE